MPEPASMKSRLGSLLRLALSLVLAGAVVWLVADQWEALAPVLRNADPVWLAAGAGIFLGSILFRALRFHWLTGGRLPVWPVGYVTTGTHGVLTYLLPMRVGEFSLPSLLRSACGTTWSEGLHILIWSRVLDVCALGLCILAAASVIPSGVSGQTRLLWFLCGAAFAAAPFILLALSRLQHLRPAWLFRHVHHLAHYGRVDARGLGTSLAVWVCTGMMNYCTAMALNMRLKPGDAWFLSTVQLPLQISPVQGVANAGSHEAGWMGALLLLGYDSSEALRFALAGHMVILMYVAALAAVVAALAGWIRFFGRGP
jgi:hypothetical protein